MLSIDAEFESGVTMYAFVETEEDAIDALGDMAYEQGEDPVEVRKDNKPWDWQAVPPAMDASGLDTVYDIRTR